ncbi:kininogen-1-like [Amblyraja radiata]|uniref:kininogen-1-like n=1 Tax=Amblyraja radiata TaxID=386614 RepID=UPI001403F2EB|nr:kininogen-1-like [Amblyraja radiata]
MACGVLVYVLLCFSLLLLTSVTIKSAEIFIQVPVSDREANLAVDYAVNAYNRKSANPYLFKQQQLKSAKYKITSPGVKAYTVIFDIKESVCQEQVELRTCRFKSDGDAVEGVCKAEIFFQFGFNIKVPKTPMCDLRMPIKKVVETIAIPCEDCPVSASLDNPMVKASVELALKIFNYENKKKRTFALNKILYAIKEVVMGEIYWVHFRIWETECGENKKKHWSDCPLKAIDEAIIGDCRAVVLFPIGDTTGQIRGIPKCQLIQLIMDEDVSSVPCIDCLRPLKVTDPRVHKVVEHSISKFNDNSGQLYKFVLARVLSAVHENSIGENITLNFELIETTCPNNNETVPDMCGPKIPATAGSAVCFTMQTYGIFGKLVYHKLTCNVTIDWKVYILNYTEVFWNETDYLKELQPEESTVSEFTIKTSVEPTPLPAGPQSSEVPAIMVEESRPTVAGEITGSELVDE